MSGDIEISQVGEVVLKQLSNGTYKIMIWGSQGGYINNVSAGRGSYSEGILVVKKELNIYAYVGKKGSCQKSVLPTDTFNGGSNAIGTFREPGCTGGSLSMIYINNNPNNPLLVAGSGGGSGHYISVEYSGGYGGPYASDGFGNEFTEGKANVTGKGARVNSPGEGGRYYNWDMKGSYLPCNATSGSRYKGGDACTSAEGSSGGGGSGLLGGGGGADIAGGGGGSSFASNILRSVILLDGNTYFTSPTGEAEKGHAGDGFIRIKQIEEESVYEVYCNVQCTEEPGYFLLHYLMFEIFMGSSFEI